MLATFEDLLARWPECPMEQPQAQVLLDDASAWLQVMYPEIGVAPAAPVAGVVRMVVCQMVRRVANTVEAAGVASLTDTAGPFTWTKSMSNPDGNFYLTAQEKALLEAALSGSGRSRGMCCVEGVGW